MALSTRPAPHATHFLILETTLTSMADGGDISSFLSSSPLHVDCSSAFTQFLSFNQAKRRFIWNGSVEELSTFIEVKFAMVNDCNGGGFVKLSTNSCAVFKLPLNFSLLLCKSNCFCDGK